MTHQSSHDLPPGLSQPALRALHGAGYTRLDQLTTAREAEIRELHGMGPKALGLIRSALSARGLSFAAPDTSTAREAYIKSIDPLFVPVVLAIDRAVLSTHPAMETKISYQMLTYAVGGDFRHWVCAIGVTSKLVCLRFLYGVLLDDPKGVLRAGTGQLTTIDFRPDGEVDPQLVTDYVNEALAKLDHFKAISGNP